jgi:hypothetical protein
MPSPTKLREAVVELLTYYAADDVLAEIRRVLDDTRVPLPQTDTSTRAGLASRIDDMLREVCP